MAGDIGVRAARAKAKAESQGLIRYGWAATRATMATRQRREGGREPRQFQSERCWLQISTQRSVRSGQQWLDTKNYEWRNAARRELGSIKQAYNGKGGVCC